MRTRPEVPSSGMVFRRKSGKTKAFCATARCGIPACLRIHTAQPLQPGLSPLHDLFSPALRTSPSGSCRCAEMRPYRPSPMKDAGAAHRPLPRKKEISLICGRPERRICPDCSLCRAAARHAPEAGKTGPSPCLASAAPCPLRVCCPQPSGMRFALSGRNTMHSRHGHDDTAGPHALPPCTYHSTGGPERDGCPGRCDTVAWT